MRDLGLRKAIAAAKGQAALAEAIGRTKQAVNQWKRVPGELVPEVERATGVPREQLRPDLYRKGGK